MKAPILAALVAALAVPALAGPAPTLSFTLKDHRFSPAEATVPAGEKIRIELANQDSSSEEFDSDDLHVEQTVTPHGRVAFTVGPLKPGAYDFMGELHADTAQGRITAAPAS